MLKGGCNYNLYFVGHSHCRTAMQYSFSPFQFISLIYPVSLLCIVRDLLTLKYLWKKSIMPVMGNSKSWTLDQTSRLQIYVTHRESIWVHLYMCLLVCLCPTKETQILNFGIKSRASFRIMEHHRWIISKILVPERCRAEVSKIRVIWSMVLHIHYNSSASRILSSYSFQILVHVVVSVCVVE